MKLKNKVALITASTGGIGLACVHAFLKEGAYVYMAARNLERAKSVIQALTVNKERIKPVYFDAAKPESLISMVDDVVNDCGRIDILVNNYGKSDPQADLDLANTTSSVFLETVMQNLQTVFTASQQAAKYMSIKSGGSIINISSVSGIVPDISQIAYGTSKAAINYLTKLIAVQEAKNNIRCNAILPGITATDAVEKNLTVQFREEFIKHVPLHRIAKPEEVAAAAVYLAGDDASYVTGQILTVSGGFGLASPLYGDYLNKNFKR